MKENSRIQDDKVPGIEGDTIQALDDAYVAHTYARFPLTLVRGVGAELFDEQGTRYIDLGSGIAVNTFGAADSLWVEAVAAQAARLQHTSNLYYTEPCTRLAEMLCERTGLSKVFFSNSGAEANECAIKAARRWAFERYGDESHATIITMRNSFHGRTVTTLAATGQDAFHREFGPFTDGFVYVEAEDVSALETAVAAQGCAAVMLEVIQGEGGVVPLSAAYLAAVARIVEENDLLLIIDEVQTGTGRTGLLFSYMHHGLEPDIVTTAKGLAGGLPLGATLLGGRVADVYTPGSHGSTFGGNPVCCAAALSVLPRIDESLLEGVRAKEVFIRSELEGAPGVTEISGRGLMLGISCERPLAEVVTACRERGVLVLTAHEKLRLLPPLNIPDDLLAEAVAILKEVLAA